MNDSLKEKSQFVDVKHSLKYLQIQNSVLFNKQMIPVLSGGHRDCMATFIDSVLLSGKKKAAISSTRISNALTTNSVEIIKELFYIIYKA